MMKCELNEFPCVDIQYEEFDRICREEIAIPIEADSIINHSKFCTQIPLKDDFRLDGLKVKDYIKGLNKKEGLYHLWVDYDDCDDHSKYTMLCVYVGKGMAEGRILKHIKDKFPNADTLFVSFYECNNRVAKYLEQLFLDLYNPALNKSEKRGKDDLYAVWNEERYLMGTEMHEVANVHSKKTRSRRLSI